MFAHIESLQWARERRATAAADPESAWAIVASVDQPRVLGLDYEFERCESVSAWDDKNEILAMRCRSPRVREVAALTAPPMRYVYYFTWGSWDAHRVDFGFAWQ